MELSIIIPVYDCDACLHELCSRISTTLRTFKKSYEIILINDGSGDLSWETIRRLSKSDHHVKGIQLSRNFGQHHAITAGTDTASGNWVVVMDCDLQDRPEEIPNLYKKAQEGFDIVFTVRTGRKDTMMKKILSYAYNRVFQYLTGIKSSSGTDNFSISSKRVIATIRTITEQNRSYLQSLKWVGFTQTTINVIHAPRYKGNSSYTISKLFSYAINSIIAYSDRPLLLSVQFGFFIAFVSLLIGLTMLFRYFYLHVPIMGYTSLIVTLTFSVGIVIADLGVIGLYIGKIFNETKHRPLYIIKETTGTIRK